MSQINFMIILLGIIIGIILVNTVGWILYG